MPEYSPYIAPTKYEWLGCERCYENGKSILKDYLENLKKIRGEYYKKAFETMGVPKELICVEKAEELKEWLRLNNLHFQWISGEKDFIVCIRDNSVEYFKEIVYA